MRATLLMNSVVAVVSLVGSSLLFAGVNSPEQSPLFTSDSAPPLNMLVMGRDHKLYYEAYNDAADLDDDGVIDVGFKPEINYYGYFKPAACYVHQNSRFEPTAAAGNGNTCTGAWSGNYLNYLATSRMDALRKVLYGGYRSTDSTTETVLRAAFIPQDAHSWGKEYDPARDTYDITDYTPLAEPGTGYRHLFAVTTLTDGGVPELRVLTNTTFRVWNWVSKERPVAGTNCVNSSGATVGCTTGGPSSSWQVVPAAQFPSGLSITTWKDSVGNPANTAAMDTLFAGHAEAQRCGTGTVTEINKTANNNPFQPGAASCTHDNYHTLITGTIRVTETGYYYFSVNGDDALDVTVNNQLVASWYGGHGWHGATPSDSDLNGHSASGGVYLTANTDYTINFRHEEGGGDDKWVLYWKPAGAAGPSDLDGYALDILTCPASNDALREENCKAYQNSGTALYKPTGLLHDFGESDRMYFGLLTGSYAKNIAGGVLRSNIDSFTREVDAETGQFETVDGIVSTINKLRVTDFDYGSYAYNNCGWITDGPITQTSHVGKCAMWGNPIAEMMYETLRYFAGASAGRSEYTYSSGAKDENTPLQLPAPTWKPPYAEEADGGGGYASCSKPVMTVISDINPSYDYKLPGSHWSAIGNSTDPVSLTALDVSDEADAIGEAEELHGKTVFIGESNGVADSAPTPKEIVSLSTVRGLSPEEPSKEGTYYSASVAKYGAENTITADNPVMTYAVALASPLPKIVFPVGENIVTVVPFAKSVGGSGISATGSFQPTDQIVDYYVTQIANTDTSAAASDFDATVNGGRPFAQFRINYEDVEQGADHDMDAISLYTLYLNEDDELVIDINSEYAAGGIDQYMGYVISGTTADGIYLEVKDQGGADIAYKLNTPAGELPGFCDVSSKPASCTGLPLTSSRTFTASSTAGASILNDPLWYAAKYGIPDRDPEMVAGTPDNYFLVTNALTLKERLEIAFRSIEQRNNAVSSPAVVPVTSNDAVDDSFSVYRSGFDVTNWSGELTKQTNSATGIATVWKASEEMPAASTRTILMAGSDDDGLVNFDWSNVRARGVNGVYAGVNLQQALATDPDNANVVPPVDANGELTDADDIAAGQKRIDFVRGTDTSYRDRDSLLGDIINSSPVVVQDSQYLSYLADQIDGDDGDYAAFAADVADREGLAYVGANDGMLHAFNLETGVEKFAFVPSAVIAKLNLLTSSDYNESGGRHQYYVDGALVVRDVYFDGNWRTVLVGTLGAGGKSMFALDITDPDQIELLWEFSAGDDLQGAETLSDVGYSFPKPTLARLHSGQWAVVTGNGYDSASGRAVLLLLDIETGAVIRKLPVAASDTDNGLSTVRVADNNGDGFADYVYAGDLKGNLWRFDLIDTSLTDPLLRTKADADINASVFRVSFGGDPLYSAKDADDVAQAITAPPSLVRHPSVLGYIVMFGTGRYFTLSDKTSTDEVQTLYGIWDRQTKGEATTSTPELDRDNLQEQSFYQQLLNTFTTTEDDPLTEEVDESKTVERTIRLLTNNVVEWYGEGDGDKYGWYLDFVVDEDLRGERLVDEMAPRGDVLLLTTRIPESSACEPGLKGFIYGIDPYSGGRAAFTVFDFNGDREVNAQDDLSTGSGSVPGSGYESIGGGFTTLGNELVSPDGSSMRVDTSSRQDGRQSWRLIPDSEE